MRTCIILLVCLGCIAAADVELSLDDGRTLRGELVAQQEDGAVVLRRFFWANGEIRHADQPFAAATILRRKEVPSARQQYDERVARTPDTIPEQCSLAQWAYESFLREQARTHALRVLELDGESAWARRILDNCGYLEVEGKWVDAAEYLKANNLVRIDGKLVPAGLAEARREYLRCREADAQAQRKLEEERARAGDKPRSAAAAQAEAKQAERAAETAAKAVAVAEERLKAVRESPQGAGDQARKERQDRLAKAQEALNAARQAQREATTLANQKTKAAEKDRAAGDRAKSVLPELQAAATKAAAALKAAAAKLPPDDPLLVAEPKPETPAEKPADETGAKPAPADAPEPTAPRRLRPGPRD